MPFYRFDELEGTYLTPRLSSAHGPIIEGSFIYFCLNCKEPGTGSVVHYHPNELLILPILGKINSLVGTDRRIVPPGTFIHIPPFGQHQMTATEDGPLQYLYIKDKTWTTVGLSVDEAIPEKATSLEEANREFAAAGWEPGKGRINREPEKSTAIVDGLENCYHPIIDDFDKPPASANLHYRFEGARMVFEYREIVKPCKLPVAESAHEQFLYVLHGSLSALLDERQQEVRAGGIVHVPPGARFGLATGDGPCVRYVAVQSTGELEAALTD